MQKVVTAQVERRQAFVEQIQDDHEYCTRWWALYAISGDSGMTLYLLLKVAPEVSKQEEEDDEDDEDEEDDDDDDDEDEDGEEAATGLRHVFAVSMIKNLNGLPSVTFFEVGHGVWFYTENKMIEYSII